MKVATGAEAEAAAAEAAAVLHRVSAIAHKLATPCLTTGVTQPARRTDICHPPDICPVVRTRVYSFGVIVWGYG